MSLRFKLLSNIILNRFGVLWKDNIDTRILEYNNVEISSFNNTVYGFEDYFNPVYINSTLTNLTLCNEFRSCITNTDVPVNNICLTLKRM